MSQSRLNVRANVAPADTAVDHPQSGDLFRSLSVIALAGHALILVATFLARIWPLVAINVASCAIYAVAILANRRGWYRTVVAIGLVEVTVHAVVATAILGWASGFHIYLLALIPLVFFFDPWSMRARGIASLAIALFYVAFAWFSRSHLPDDPRWFVEWFRYGNLLVGSIVLCALAYYYGTAVRQAQIDLEQKNAELDILARTDALTGLPNRREAMSLIEWEQVRCVRSAESFALAVVDVDYFKRINDEHGHSCGDDALRQVAAALRASLRAQDSVARWGGEEFLLILPRTEQEGARIAAEKARAAVEATGIDLGDAVEHVTVTIGVAVVECTSDASEALTRADHAMYAGKRAGRNQVSVAD